MDNARVVVIGGSVAGLLAAVALSETFREVVILERDDLVDGPEPRNGVPQGKQIHVILPVGLEMIEELLPGFTDHLQSVGCPTWDQVRDVATLTENGWRARGDSPVQTVGFRRPLFEWVIRQRVTKIPQVSIRKGAVSGLTMSADSTVVTGVLMASGESVAADLVVDASGRGSSAPAWLAAHGHGSPPEAEVQVFMGYASQVIRLGEDALPPGTVGIEAMPYPGHLRGAALLPADNGLHMLTAIGMMKDYPPRKFADFLTYLDDAPTKRIAEVARRSEPVGDLHVYRSPGDRRRLWESLENPPVGFIAVGDAVASFNPIYGQGMTQAANSALTLRALLRANSDVQTLAQPFHGALAEWTDIAFGMAASADAAFPGAIRMNWSPTPSTDPSFDEDIAVLATVEPAAAVALAKSEFSMDFTDLNSIQIRDALQEWRRRGRQRSGLGPHDVPTLHAAAQ